jgi:adenylate kinase
MERLIIAVSGTPGTGKSEFARVLARKLNAHLIDLNEFIRKKKIYTRDADGNFVADERKMRAEFARVVKNTKGHIVVEGLLAHLLQTKYLTHVVVLRTHPEVLERRLRARGYSGAKLRDNIEAEALGIILWEAVHAHEIDKVYEIDTTKLGPRVAVKLFTDALSGKVSLRPGKIDWLEEVF